MLGVGMYFPFRNKLILNFVNELAYPLLFHPPPAKNAIKTKTIARVWYKPTYYKFIGEIVMESLHARSLNTSWESYFLLSIIER